MKIIESIKTTLYVLSSHKFRSFLMLLGVVIGVASVIVVVAIGTAGQKKIEKELETFGIHSVWIWRDQKSQLENIKENFYSSNNEISNVDVESVKSHFPEIICGTPCLYAYNIVKFEKKSERMGILGTNEKFAQSNNEKLLMGRFFSSWDIQQQRRVCVISYEIFKRFFNLKNPLTESIAINNEKFIIVGVLSKKETQFLQAIQSIKDGSEEGLYLPISVIQGWYKTVNITCLQAKIEPAKSEEILNQLKGYLSLRHNSVPIFKTESMQTYIQTSNKIMGTLKTVLATIAAISLLVGGLGIMNIMLISVKERTRKIGIRKAVGAKSQDIVLQFLMESIVVSCSGGLVGIVIGMAGVIVISSLVKVGGLISIYSVAIAFFSSVFVGITAGIYPAVQAATLDPIVCLRCE